MRELDAGLLAQMPRMFPVAVDAVEKPKKTRGWHGPMETPS
jgi:hypothetical protein